MILTILILANIAALALLVRNVSKHNREIEQQERHWQETLRTGNDYPMLKSNQELQLKKSYLEDEKESYVFDMQDGSRLEVRVPKIVSRKSAALRHYFMLKYLDDETMVFTGKHERVKEDVYLTYKQVLDDLYKLELVEIK
jgi:predicted Holliday junction resolvase-like endonuclease